MKKITYPANQQSTHRHHSMHQEDHQFTPVPAFQPTIIVKIPPRSALSAVQFMAQSQPLLPTPTTEQPSFPTRQLFTPIPVSMKSPKNNSMNQLNP
jgi:hypothetical protein